MPSNAKRKAAKNGSRSNQAATAGSKPKGIGDYAFQLMRTTELSNEQILAKILAKFPDAQTKYASIVWYRTKINKENKTAA